MTLKEFKQIPPSGSEILLLFENTSIGLGNYSYTVKAVNVDITPCNTADGKNISELAETATYMTLDIDYSPVGGDFQQLHRTVIQDREVQDGYYYFKIEPFTFTHDDSNLPQVSSCAVGTGRYFDLDGSVPDVLRESDDDNVIMNNVQSTPTSGDDLIMKVLYRSQSPTPFNLNSILTGSAEKSDVQIYNYEATGLKRGRYEGSKTNKDDYGGISSALSLTSFRAAAYQTRVSHNFPTASESDAPGNKISTLTDREDGFICSQSFEERPMKTYYFDVNREHTTVDQVTGISGIQIPEVRTTRIFTTKAQYALSQSNEITVPNTGYAGPSNDIFSVPTNLDIEVGDVLAFSYYHPPGDTDRYENMLVETVTHYSASQDGPILQTTASLQRNYYSTYDENTLLRDWDGSDYLAVHKYTPDVIYALDEAQPYKVRDKKIWIQQSQKVYYVDREGRLVIEMKEC